MLFEWNEGAGWYDLKSTAWSDSFMGPIHISQEVFNFEDGRLVDCEANDCTSCAVCDDNVSVLIDCTTWAYDCDKGYSGSIANSYDFGIIVEAVENGEGK